MSVNEERKKIPNKIRDGKVTGEDGARLLAASREGQSSSSVAQHRLPSGLTLHIRVTDVSSGRFKANVQLPLSIVDAGIKLGARFIPEGNATVMARFINAIHSGATGKVYDHTDKPGGERVEVFIE